MFSAALKRRCTALRELSAILDGMRNKIRYRTPRMSELIEETAGEAAFSGNIFIKKVCSGLRSGMTANEAWISSAETTPFFSDTDREILTEIGAGLGNSDTEGQLSLLSLGSAMIGRALEDAEREYAGKSRMLMSVWTLCGIGAGIIII